MLKLWNSIPYLSKKSTNCFIKIANRFMLNNNLKPGILFRAFYFIKYHQNLHL